MSNNMPKTNNKKSKSKIKKSDCTDTFELVHFRKDRLPLHAKRITTFQLATD